MKIFLTSGDNPYQKQIGGKHIHQLLFEKGLNELDFKVETYYPTYTKRKKIETAIKLFTHLLPINSYGFLEYRLKFDAKEMFQNGLHSFTNNYDIVHAQDPISLLYTSAIQSRKRIVTLHGYFTKECVNYSKIADKYIERFSKWGMEFERKSYQLADHFICVDSNIRDYLMDEFNIPKEKISVIFNAIDTIRFSPPASDEIKKLRTAFGFKDYEYLILVPRRLVKKNGVHMALRAMKNISDENTILLIAGDGPERKAIEEESGGDKRIHFLGSINHEKVIDYFKITDCVLIPSITSSGFQEATSLAMLEGMSMSKPTICSAIGGMKEVIKHNETGFLVEEQNPLAIANQINWIKQHQDKVATITTNARNYILENHHYLSHTKKIVNFY